MSPWNPRTVGALLAALTVVFGAFATHALKTQLTPEALNQFEIGARYQMYAALALLALGSEQPWRGSAAFLLGGGLIFSGSLYLLALSGWQWLGAITPLGGVLMIWGFVLLVWKNT